MIRRRIFPAKNATAMNFPLIREITEAKNYPVKNFPTKNIPTKNIPTKNIPTKNYPKEKLS
jgi:hypothetical protein